MPLVSLGQLVRRDAEALDDQPLLVLQGPALRVVVRLGEQAADQLVVDLQPGRA